MVGGPAQTSCPDGGRLNLWPLALVILILGFALFGDRGILHMLKLSGQKAFMSGKLKFKGDMNLGMKLQALGLI